MSKRPYIIGIDPGLNGAIAIVDYEKLKCVDIQDIPAFKKRSTSRKRGFMTHIDVHKLSAIVDSYAGQTALAVIEEPGAMPNQGLSSTFRFGHACGQCHGVLAANYLTTIPVKPSVWKPAIGLSGRKGNSIEMAREVLTDSKQFFQFKKHHDRAEAALIAYYAIKYMGHVIEECA